MKKYYLFQLLLLFMIPLQSEADWNAISTGISDNFNSVFFKDANNGMLAGSHGIYYTQNGASGSWTRYSITGNTTDSLIYNHSVFKDISYISQNDLFYFCGTDTIQHKAIIIAIHATNLTYDIEYIGPPNSSLNALEARSIAMLIAVGDRGFAIGKFLATTYAQIANPDTNDLYAVNFRSGSSYYSVAGKEVWYKNALSAGPVMGSKFTLQNRTIKGLISQNYSFYGAGSFYETIDNSNSIDTYSYYDFGPLNATGICLGSSGKYVSTNHGIFYSSSISNTTFEYQPSSNAGSFNDIMFLSSGSNEGYACGNNGALMHTINGAATKPYAYCIHNNGACTTNNVFFQAFAGSGTNCIWKVGTTTVSSSCNSYSFYNSTPGTYTVNYIVTNSFGLADTFSATFNIETPPNTTNLIVTLNDSLLCKKEPALFTIQNTQIGFNYWLQKDLVGCGFIPGNGGTVSLVSDSGLISGNDYQISIRSQNSICNKTLSQQHAITVEEVYSRLHSGLFNAELGEPVAMNAITKDAQNFIWNFQPGSSLTSSNIKNPVVSFNNLGLAQMELISWSNNGCYDTATLSGPNIIAPLLYPDSCFVLQFDCNDVPFNGNYVDKIYHHYLFKNGILIGGNAYQDSFITRYGLSPERRVNGGAFLHHYNKNGVYRWSIKGFHQDYDAEYFRQTFRDMVSDPSGYIYTAGFTNTDGIFTDNKGEVYQPGKTFIPQGIASEMGFISKFDSIGRHLWSSQFNNMMPEKIRCDRSNNIIISGRFWSNNFNYYSSTGISSLFNFPFTTPTSANKNILVKIDSSGQLLWSVFLDNGGPNPSGRFEIDLDSSNNIYVLGNYDRKAQLFNANNYITAVDTLTFPGMGTGNFGGYLAKYSPTGNLLWRVNMTTRSNLSFRYSSLDALATDVNGNSYISGINGIRYPNDTLIIELPNGTQTFSLEGSLFLMRIDASGNLNWTFGRTNPSIDHTGSDIWIDGNDILFLSKIHITNKKWGFTMNTIGGPVTFQNLHRSFNLMSFNAQGAMNSYMLFGENQDTTINSISSGSTANVIRDTDGFTYIHTDLRYLTNPPYLAFSTPIITNGVDGILLKIGGNNCSGITGLPLTNLSNHEIILAYPNPTTGQVAIQNDRLPASYKVEIYSSTGQLIYAGTHEDQNLVLNLNDYTRNPGLYIVSIVARQLRYSTKVMLVNE